MERVNPWWKSAVIYHIYLRSFSDHSGDGIGDLRGVLSRLDYLTDSSRGLGVNALWLSPIFPSPNADFGYDVSDFTAIHPQLGTMDDFKELLDACHKRNVKVILDIPFNHTSNVHRWFVESQSSKENPKRDWYIWHPGVNGKPPNNWASRFGGKAWTFDKTTNEFYLHSFLKEQPDLNWRNPEVKKAVFDVMTFWFELGVDGFRLDVFNSYFKDKQLRSNPLRGSLRGLFYKYESQRHVHDKDQDDVCTFATEMRAFADAFGDKLLLGEIDSDHGRHMATKCLGPHGDGLHLAFHFEFLQVGFKAQTFRKKIIRWERELPRKAWPTYVLGNHDVSRLMTRYGNKPTHARLLAALLLYVRGTPIIYYGDELGLSEATLTKSQIADPAGRIAWPFYKGRDGARTPMPWDESQGAGFSSDAKALPWLPLPTEHRVHNVEASLKNPASLLNHYRQALRLREQYKALQLGDMRFFKQKNPQLLVFSRTLGAESILVVLNFSSKAERANLWQSFSLTDLVHGYQFITKSLRVAAFEILVFKVEG